MPETAERKKHLTLDGTTIEEVHLTDGFERVEVLNRTGTADLWITATRDGSEPPDPEVEGDDCDVVPAGTYIAFAGGSARHGTRVKVLGDGNKVSVVGAEI